jgi:ankyrin repeat protein
MYSDRTPWQQACQSLDWPEMGELLLAKQAHPDDKLDAHGKQNEPLFETAAIKAIKLGCVEVVKNLLEAGSNSNYVDQHGNSLLHYCIQRGANPALIYLLAKHGAHIDTLSTHNETALSLAARKGLLELAEALLECGAEPDIRVDGDNTALMIACSMHWDPICHALLDRGADASLLDAQGRSCQQRCGVLMKQSLLDRIAACAQASMLSQSTPGLAQVKHGRRI